MVRSSSGFGSIPAPSKEPGASADWDADGWRAQHVEEGEPLGEGGWGIVRRVRHVASGELRALKEPTRVHDEVRARFRREIDVQRKVNHRHVMPILDCGDNFDWFTMPLAARTLQHAAREMSHDDLSLVITQIARGLDAAHEHGYVHRDVKPSNILERPRGEFDPADWVVGDFGVVRRPENATTSLKTRHALGTQGFMAPEVSLGEHGSVTRLADVYSLGRTIAWATTGKNPEGVIPLDAPWPWTALVAQMTAFDPGGRPHKMADVVAEVQMVVAAVRERRVRSWGKSQPSTLSANEEALLASVFEQAWDPDSEHGEISIGVDNLARTWPMRATLRIGLRRLVQLGYLDEGTYRGGRETIRTYSPTQLAWDWAIKNEARVAAVLGSHAQPEAAGESEPDLPF